MSSGTIREHAASDGDERAIRALYQQLLDCWNERKADAMAALFAPDGSVVGFDGSPIDGRDEIAAAMGQIFGDHPTSAYIGKVRELRFLSPNVALLRMVAGMLPPGQNKIKPDVNTIQSLVAVKRGDSWQIALYQNTPAQFHGRPEAAQQLTDELQKLVEG